MGSRTNTFTKSFIYFIFFSFILWIVLFEFVLPENNVLPPPGIVLISIPALFKDYNFLNNFFTTISAIYLPGILAYLLLFSIRNFIFNGSKIIKLKFELFSGLNSIIPVFLAIVIISYWFPHSFYIEYAFSFILTLLWFSIEVYSQDKLKNESYISAFKSLGAEKKFLDKNILWNELKPVIFKKIFSYHLHLWTIILIFEFVQNNYGLGAIFRRILNFNDFAALILMIILIPIIIFCSFLCLRLIENNFVFWEAE